MASPQVKTGIFRLCYGIKSSKQNHQVCQKATKPSMEGKIGGIGFQKKLRPVTLDIDFQLQFSFSRHLLCMLCVCVCEKERQGE